MAGKRQPKGNLDTSSELLRELGENADSPRWREFVELYSPLLRMWLRDIRNAHPAIVEAMEDDIIQETLVSLMKRFPSFHYDRKLGSFRGFLRRILEFKAMKAMETNRLTRSGMVRFDSDIVQATATTTSDESSADPIEERIAMQREIWAILLRRVFSSGRFSAQTEAVFRESVAGEMSAEEIARRHNTNANAVYQIKNRIVREVRQQLETVRKGSDDLFDLLDRLVAEEAGFQKDEGSCEEKGTSR